MPHRAHRIVSRRVVALPDSPRLREFLEQPAAEGFEVFPAYDGRDGSLPPFIDLAAYRARIGRAPRGGEVGCTASHYLLMRSFASSDGAEDDLLLVAEDDARFFPDFTAALARILRRRRPIGVALLAHPAENSQHRNLTGLSERTARISMLATPIAVRTGTPVVIGATRGMLRGTGLYLISRGACRTVMRYIDEEHGGRLAWHADAYEVWADPAGVRLDLVRPNLAGWEGSSQIGGEDHPGSFAASTRASRGTGGGSLMSLGVATRLRRALDAIRITRYDLRHWRS